jgi:hypothetical protein
MSHVVDEGAASVYGANWQAKSSAAAVNGTYLQKRKTSGRLVQWGIDQDPNIPAGFYDVFVNWLAQDGTQTTYFVTAGTGFQQIDVPHAGHSPGDWVHLGTFEFEGQHPVYGPTNTFHSTATTAAPDCLARSCWRTPSRRCRC